MHKFIFQQTLRPKCGRLVGFESSDYHGVLAINKGKRCALAAWYTLDPDHVEPHHKDARAILDSQLPSERLIEKQDGGFSSMVLNATETVSEYAHDVLVATGEWAANLGSNLQSAYSDLMAAAFSRFLQVVVEILCVNPPFVLHSFKNTMYIYVAFSGFAHTIVA